MKISDLDVNGMIESENLRIRKVVGGFIYTEIFNYEHQKLPTAVSSVFVPTNIVDYKPEKKKNDVSQKVKPAKKSSK